MRQPAGDQTPRCVPSSARRTPSRRGRSAGIGVALSVAMLASSASASSAQPAGHTPVTTARAAAPRTAATPPTRQAVVSSNPLAGHRWGVYKGNADQSWQPYVRSTGASRALLAKISLRPKAKWFGKWISNATIQSKVRAYIANSTGGDPDVLVQMSVFRMVPWEHAACTRLPTAAEQASYKQWTDRFAAGIGNARVAIILQPDGPFALCAPNGSLVPSSLIAYSARKFSALPRTSVYIDAGAADWPSGHPDRAAQILIPAGVQYARVFALNSTHYSSTSSNITFGTHLLWELEKRGVTGKHFVINTSSNGQPFTFNKSRGSNPDNAKVCATKTEKVCVTLGIPPTPNVTSPRWGLSAKDTARVGRYVDGFMWFGRPWLYMQADPFDLPRALALARTTPY